jgi:hypothetical protein
VASNLPKGMPEHMTPEEIKSFVVGNPIAADMLERDEAQFDDTMANLYRHYGYDPEGNELSKAQKGIRKVSEATGIPEWLTTAAAASVVPTITTAAGAIGGMAVSGPVGGYVGAVAGSLGGEQLNVEMGITDPMDAVDVGIAAGAPLVPVAGRVAKETGKRVLKHLPGAGVGMHQAALDTAVANAAKFGATKEGVTTAWDAVSNLPAYRQEMPKLAKLLQDEGVKLSELTAISPTLADTKYGKQVKGILNTLQEVGTINNKQIGALQHFFNKEKIDNPGSVWAKASGVLMDDLEDFATAGKYAPEASATVMGLQKATQMTKRLHASEDMDKLLARVTSEKLSDGVTKFNRDAFVKGLREEGKKGYDRVFERGFGADDVNKMITAVKDLGYIAPMPTESISTIGREMLPFASIGAGAAAITGSSAYMPIMAAGVVIGATIKKILTTETGRNWVARLAKEQGGRVSALQLSEMSMALAGGTSGAAIGAMVGAKREPSGTSAFPMEE